MSDELSARAEDVSAPTAPETELRSRALALALGPSANGPEPTAKQTSPRYAAFDTPELRRAWVAGAWLAGVEDVSTLRAAASALAGSPGAVLERELVARGLAERVSADVSLHGAFSALIISIAVAPRGARTDLVAALQAALDGAAIHGGDEVTRRAARELLAKNRRNVVELVPRNAPDPGVLAAAQTSPGIDGKDARRAPKKRSAPGLSKQASKARGASKARSASEASDRSKKGRRQERVHAVKRGDTLSELAVRYKTSVGALARVNGIDPSRPIRSGQKLVIAR